MAMSDRASLPPETVSPPARRRRVLLVGAFRSMIPEGGDSPFGSQGGFSDTLALAPYSLANAYLKTHAEADNAVAERYEIRLLDIAEPLELEDEREEVGLQAAHVDRIVSEQPDIVGFSTYCWNVDSTLEACAELRRRMPGVRIVLGGRGTEGDPEQLLASAPAVDALVIGEGELPFRELLRRGEGPWTGIPGVICRHEGVIHHGGPKAALRDLDEIPSPFQRGVLHPARHAMMLELSRGCLHACGYCTWNSDKCLRYFSVARVASEVRWALEQGHRHITLNDSAINYDTERLARVVDAIRGVDPEGVVEFTYNVRHDCLTANQLESLARLPTHMVLCGVETLSSRGMADVQRAPVDAAKLRGTLGALGRATRPPVASIVLGLPGETEDDFLHTLETLLRWTRPEQGAPPAVGTVLVSLLQVYRGSSLWERRLELGLKFNERGIPYLKECPSWPAEALARAKAHVLRRMSELPDQLKAAEAIVFMDAAASPDPWLTRERVSALIRPWEPGQVRGGWTLERVGVARDNGQSVLLRFRWQDGGGMRIRLQRNHGRPTSPVFTGRYELTAEPLRGGQWPPKDARIRLMRAVQATIARAEEGKPATGD